MKEKIIELLNKGKSYKEIMEILNCSKGIISYHYNKNKNLIIPEYQKINKKFDWEEIQKIYNQVESIKATARHFSMSTSTIDKAIKNGFLNKISFDRSKYFVENSPHARHAVKKYIIKYNLIEYICEQCKCDPIWKNKELVLVLDHINGINNDNRLENLRFLCPNCNSQTDTFCRKNK